METPPSFQSFRELAGHAVSGPLKEPTGVFLVREVASFIGPNGRSLIPLKNPQMGPESGGEMTEKA